MSGTIKGLLSKIRKKNNLKSSLSIPNLIERLSDAKVEVRSQAVIALKSRNLRNIEKPLMEALESNNAHTRKLAIEILIQKNWVPGSVYEETLYLAAKQKWSLLKMKKEEALDTLALLVRDSQSDIRRKAIDLLLEIGTDKAKVISAVALDDQDSSIRERVQNKLKDFVTEDFKLLELLLSMLPNWDSNAFGIVIPSLGAIEDTKALKPLLALKETSAFSVSRELSYPRHASQVKLLKEAIARIIDNRFIENVGLVCDQCYLEHKEIKLWDSWFKDIKFMACPQCHSNFHGVGRVSLLMDASSSIASKNFKDASIVNWSMLRKEICCHDIWIKDATDEDIRLMVEQLKNAATNAEIDLTRIPVHISTKLQLLPETEEWLKENFISVDRKFSSYKKIFARLFYIENNYRFPGYKQEDRWPLASMIDGLTSGNKSYWRKANALLRSAEWEKGNLKENADFFVVAHQWERLLSMKEIGLEALTDRLKGDFNRWNKEVVQNTILKFHPDLIMKILPSRLNSGSPQFRKRIAGILEQLNWKPTGNIEKVLYLMAQQKWEELKGIGEKAIEPFIRAIKINESSDCMDIAMGLSKIAEPWILKPLLALAVKEGDSYTEARHSAQASLFTFSRVEWLNGFLNLARIEKDNKLDLIIQCLGRIGDSKALNVLYQLKYDSSNLHSKGNVLTSQRKGYIEEALEKIKGNLILDNGRLVCKNCIRYFKDYRYELQLEKDLHYYACSGCLSNSSFWIDVQRILLVMDQTNEPPTLDDNGTLTVHWNYKKKPIDFDEIRIQDATDIDIEEMVVKIVNDNERSNWLEKDEPTTVYISSQLNLSRNTLNLLNDRFLVKMEE